MRRRGCRVALRSTRARGDAETFARQALQNREFGGGPDVVVAAGGDGTINEVVNGMIGSAMQLAILPLGTANVLAAEIGTPRSADAIADAIVAGRTRSVHIGTANNRAFLQMAGIGMDAHVVERVSSPLKHLMGKAAYGLAILRWLMAPPLTRYEVHVGNLRFSAASVIVANGRYYGGTFVCAPAASLDIPTFEVCIFEKGVASPGSSISRDWAWGCSAPRRGTAFSPHPKQRSSSPAAARAANRCKPMAIS